MAVTAGRGVGGVGRGGNAGTTADNVLSGTSNTTIGQREDLSNFISMITRDETPFISSIGKTKATAVYHEWQTDELAPPGDSRMPEGADYKIPTNYMGASLDTYNSITGTGIDGLPTGGDANTFGLSQAHTGPNRTRLGNYTQINGKSMAISGTRRVIDSAGVADEYAYQLKKRGTELRRDIEAAVIHSYQVADGASALRKAGGYQSWINDDSVVEYVGQFASPAAAVQGTGRGANDSVSNVTSGALRATTTDGTTTPTRGALSLSDIDQVMQNLYEQGGKAGRIMLSPKLRRDFSDLMVNDAGVRRNLDEKGKLRQSVDVYMSDFGDLMVVPNYIMGLNNNVRFPNSNNNVAAAAQVNVANFAAFIYDPEWFSMVTLRPLQELDIGQRGDSTVGMMVEEWSFECKNPLGSAAIYGLE